MGEIFNVCKAGIGITERAQTYMYVYIVLRLRILHCYGV